MFFFELNPLPRICITEDSCRVLRGDQRPPKATRSDQRRFLGVLGRPENRTPVEKKIRRAFFRGFQKTGRPNTGWEKNLGNVFWGSSEDRKTGHRKRKKSQLLIFTSLRKTGDDPSPEDRPSWVYLLSCLH